MKNKNCIHTKPFLLSSMLLFIVQLTLCYQLAAQADSAAYSDRTVASKKWDSLPVNSTFQITKDSEGYLWLLTEEGPVPFDGMDFRAYDKGTGSDFASFDFTSGPLFYQTIWFIGIILVVLFPIGYLFYTKHLLGLKLKEQVRSKNLELKQQKQTLETALKEVASKNQLIEKVAWVESHKLRGPLSKIIGLVDVVKRYSQFKGIKKTKKQLIDDISTAADELDHILRSLNSNIEEIEKKMAKVDLFQVIIIDDDKAILFLNELIIRKSLITKHVRKFLRAKEALEFFNTRKADDVPCLVFLDINMPEMNGWEFLQHLEKSGQDDRIYVVMVTSSIRSVDRNRAKQFRRVVQYVEKPLNLDRINELKKADRIGHLLAGAEN